MRAPASFLLTGGGFVFYGGLLGGALAVTVFFAGGLVALVRALRGQGVPDGAPPRWAGAAAGLALAANWAFVVLTGR